MACLFAVEARHKLLILHGETASEQPYAGFQLSWSEQR